MNRTFDWDCFYECGGGGKCKECDSDISDTFIESKSDGTESLSEPDFDGYCCRMDWEKLIWDDGNNECRELARDFPLVKLRSTDTHVCYGKKRNSKRRKKTETDTTESDGTGTTAIDNDSESEIDPSTGQPQVSFKFHQNLAPAVYRPPVARTADYNCWYECGDHGGRCDYCNSYGYTGYCCRKHYTEKFSVAETEKIQNLLKIQNTDNFAQDSNTANSFKLNLDNIN